MNDIPYDLILKQFNPKLYHISYLTYDDLIKLMNFPIKLRPTCSQRTQNEIYYNYGCTGLIVIKHTLDYDYSIDKDIPKALSKMKEYNLSISYIAPIDYLPFKMAQILAGTGQYARNSLVYDYQFGFETHIGMAIIKNKIINLPERNKPNWDYLPQCNECNDCRNACPVNAIHNDDYPPWVDWVACNMFNRYGDHPIIPSMKYGWGKYICDPPIDNKILKQIQTDNDLKALTDYDIITSSFIENNEVKYIQYPICRECTSQPKCSKFNGQYPYNKDRVKIY